jgi:hypothetical protein
MLKRFHFFDWLLAILILLTLIASISHFCGVPGRPITTVTEQLDQQQLALNDSMPHYLYKKISDSIERLGSLKKAAARSGGSGWSFFSFGYRVINNGQYELPRATKQEEDKSYYVALSGYRLQPDAVFAIDNNKWFIRKPVWDSSVGGYTHVAAKPVSLRFAENNSDDNQPGEILLPASKQKFRVVRILTWMVGVAMIAGCFYILVTIALIIGRIINSKSFSKENYRGVMTVGLFLLVASYLPFILGLILNLLVMNRLPAEIEYHFWENLLQYQGVTFAGLIILVIARAFKQGHNIQTENESML